MLRDAVRLLRCPVCAADLEQPFNEEVLRCRNGHSFDIAKQGYVNLITGEGATAPGDSPEMVDARMALLESGVFDPITVTLQNEARRSSVSGAVIDVGSGPGYYLAQVLEVISGRLGIALDTSPAALKRAAQAHNRGAAVGADVWRQIPLKDDTAALALSIFAPRNAEELSRVLAKDGYLLVVHPTTAHLASLVGKLGLLTVPEDKDDRIDAQLAPHLVMKGRKDIDYQVNLTREQAGQLVAMGPSAWHVDLPAIRERLLALPEPVTVGISVKVSRYRSKI